MRENYWECKDNWLDVDNNPVNSAPCGNDVAVFPSVCGLLLIVSLMMLVMF